jgi:hypothetical protein
LTLLNLNEVSGKFIPQSYDLVLRRIFGLKRDEVTGEWRKLHNKELRQV